MNDFEANVQPARTTWFRRLIVTVVLSAVSLVVVVAPSPAADAQTVTVNEVHTFDNSFGCAIGLSFANAISNNSFYCVANADGSWTLYEVYFRAVVTVNIS